MAGKNDPYAYLSNKKLKVLIHILVWGIVIIVPHMLNTYRMEAAGSMPGPFLQKVSVLDLSMYIYWIGIYYLNSLVLVPRLLLTSRYPFYLLIVLVLLAGSVAADVAIRAMLDINNVPIPILCYYRFPALLLFVAAGIAFTVIENQQRYKEKLDETDKEGLKTELSFLRSQMSPHFIFNVLNNIVSLVRMKSEELEPTVIKLSGLMQYMLYHTEEEKVPLKTEVEYLENYIDLQKQRFSNKAKIDADFDTYDEHILIEPLLLIPFVENAFKHGTGLINGASISIRLKTDARNLYFTVINKFDFTNSAEKDSSSGIGIANVRRRLELLYGQYHELKIATRDNNFEVNLSIRLKHD